MNTDSTELTMTNVFKKLSELEQKFKLALSFAS